MAVAAQNPPATTTPSAPDVVTAAQRTDILKGIAEIIERRMYVTGVDVKKWSDHLAKHQADIDKADDIRGFTTAVNRAFREFGFSHLRLRSPSAARSRQTGPVAVGFGLQVEKEERGLAVRAVTPESPAAKAGLEVGDVIVELDGKAASPELLAGEAGSASKIKVLKKSGQTVEVELQRSQFSTARKETLTWIGDDVAVLRVFTFSRGYNRANLETLIGEANEKAKYLVLDLRSNGGGATDNLRHLLSLLLPPDTVIGTFINKREAAAYAEKHGEALDPIKIAGEVERKYKTSEQKVAHFKGKLAVLTNRGSASASEICAAALHEIAGAPLIGARTAGAVLASVYGRLPHGFELQYPITDYVTVKGIRLEGNPLKPDYETGVIPAAERDEAVEKAIEVLKGKG